MIKQQHINDKIDLGPTSAKSSSLFFSFVEPVDISVSSDTFFITYVVSK